MADTQVYTATQARKDFFKILNRVGKGEELIIEKRAINLRFKITLMKPERKKSAEELSKEWDAINLKWHDSMSIDKMKEIILTAHDIQI